MPSKALLLMLATTGLLAGSAAAQIDDDPMVKELKRALAELSNRQLEEDPDLARARATWPRLTQTIDAAVVEQDAALDGAPAALKEALDLHAARIGPRAAAIDHYLYGRLLGLSGQLEGAYEQFRRALEADRYFFWAWDGIGVYHLNKKSFALAREAFHSALRINPAFQKASFGLAESYIRQDDYGRAATILNDILASQGAKVDADTQKQARLNLAEVYRRQEEYARAIDELSWLIDNEVDDFGVLAMRAWCAKKLERWGDAARDYERLLVLVPKDFRYDFALADCLMQLGRNAEAADALRAGLQKGGSAIDEGQREMLERERARLERLPAVQSPEQRKRGLEDFLADLGGSADVQRRRKAALALATLTPDRFPSDASYTQFIAAFTKAISDSDEIVAAKALQQSVQRLPPSPQLLEVVDACLKHESPVVRGMAAWACQEWDERQAVPRLIRALRAEKDGYVFRRLHDSLNVLTLAFIERVLPDTLGPDDMKRVREKFDAWYQSRRDVYRKYEPEGF